MKLEITKEWLTRKLAIADDSCAAAGGLDASCFTCGHVGEPAVWLIEHPEVYVCKGCKDKLDARTDDIYTL